MLENIRFIVRMILFSWVLSILLKLAVSFLFYFCNGPLIINSTKYIFCLLPQNCWLGEPILIFIFIWGQSWRRGTNCDCKTGWLWVRSPLEKMKYLFKFIFPFHHYCVEAKRIIEFCPLTRNVSIIQRKVEHGVS